ncbi:MAG TPA: peptide-methionine (S)-S-oxide reductase MsrA [Stenotrophobium sp.]|nr:peptide-methionine (S)-S-oxide reductase MsrA [Stenotrophobium sp.]
MKILFPSLILMFSASIASAAPATAAAAHTAVATFAGGCFWCMQSDFEELPGVISVTAGYTGGKEQHPTYEQVSDHQTGHFESVELTYDTRKLSYDQVLDYFWHHVDPTDGGGQFCDRGPQYRTAIFYHDEAQHQAAIASRDRIDKSGKLAAPIVTLILPATTFWPAEDYHQDYYKKNPLRYAYYRHSCGRDARVHQVWGHKTP